MYNSLDQLDYIDKIAASSGVFIGFLGGFVKALTSAKGIFDAIGKMFVGCVVAWLSAPFAKTYLPSEFYPMAIFLCGYGGTEIVEFLHSVLISRIDAFFDRILHIKTQTDNNEIQQGEKWY